MASSSARQSRGYTQDYIARIRYSNALPPPPLPPKLLEIPNTGLSSGQYTNPGFAARLAREQPLNIEADAELGMPLDLVGMPGIFDGDESSIQAPDHPPAPHARDKPLLRPLSALGKPTSIASGVSFLRRTEYISNEQSRARMESSKYARTMSGQKRRRPTDFSRENPTNILRTVIKGFDIDHPREAYTGPDVEGKVRGHALTSEELNAWNHPQHPSKKGLTVVDTYPVIPDLDCYPDTGGYIVTKFATNPVAASETYDKRLDFALLRPLVLRPELEAAQKAAVAAHEADPSKPQPGPPPFDYEYFLPEDPESLPNISRMLDVNAPDRDDPSHYTNDKKSFRFGRIRAYETVSQSTSASSKFNEIAITLYDPPTQENGVTDGTPSKRQKQKAAYYYPIIQKTQVRPRRAANIGALGMQGAKREEEMDGDTVDLIDITIRDPDDAEAKRRAQHRDQYDASDSEIPNGTQSTEGTVS
ncbi:MAG: hypothetical protein M1833_000825 [Piccolia ochrophora]|nr:MAG: hypothetical protein M1833_000825 [Piccolia ochrophora]